MEYSIRHVKKKKVNDADATPMIVTPPNTKSMNVAPVAQSSSKSANRQPNSTEQACINNIVQNLRVIDITCYPRRPHVGEDWIAIRASTYSDPSRSNYLDESILKLDKVPENQVSRYGFSRCDAKVVHNGGITSIDPKYYETKGLITEKTHKFIHTDDIPGLPSYVIQLVKNSNKKLSDAELDTVCQTWNKINAFINK